MAKPIEDNLSPEDRRWLLVIGNVWMRTNIVLGIFLAGFVLGMAFAGTVIYLTEPQIIGGQQEGYSFD